MSQSREEKIAAVNTRLAELSAKFMQRTAGDLKSMRGGFARVAAGDWGALNEIRHLAHRMAGTGATLGFADLSDFARRVETLAEGAAPGTGPDGAALRAIGGAIDELDEEFTRIDSPPR